MDVAMPCTSEVSNCEHASSGSTSLPAVDNGADDIPTLEKQNSSDSLMQVESIEPIVERKEEDSKVETSTKKVSFMTEEEGLLLVDLFYMPFEHGTQSLFFLQRLHWLRNNADSVAKKAGKRNNTFEVNCVLC